MPDIALGSRCTFEGKAVAGQRPPCVVFKHVVPSGGQLVAVLGFADGINFDADQISDRLATAQECDDVGCCFHAPTIHARNVWSRKRFPLTWKIFPHSVCI